MDNSFTCCYCGESFARHEVRPYGPDGAMTCFPCATSTPERNALAEETFDRLVSEFIKADTSPSF